MRCQGRRERRAGWSQAGHKETGSGVLVHPYKCSWPQKAAKNTHFNAPSLLANSFETECDVSS